LVFARSVDFPVSLFPARSRDFVAPVSYFRSGPLHHGQAVIATGWRDAG
jgi:hypothetical protein